jgi:hypothetical protein
MRRTRARTANTSGARLVKKFTLLAGSKYFISEWRRERADHSRNWRRTFARPQAGQSLSIRTRIEPRTVCRGSQKLLADWVRANGESWAKQLHVQVRKSSRQCQR